MRRSCCTPGTGSVVGGAPVPPAPRCPPSARAGWLGVLCSSRVSCMAPCPRRRNRTPVRDTAGRPRACAVRRRTRAGRRATRPRRLRFVLVQARARTRRTTATTATQTKAVAAWAFSGMVAPCVDATRLSAACARALRAAGIELRRAPGPACAPRRSRPRAARAAASASVAPVVRTSSISSTRCAGSRARTRERRAHVLRAQRARQAGLVGGAAHAAQAGGVERQPERACHAAERASALWLKPRSRSRAGCSGSGTSRSTRPAYAQCSARQQRAERSCQLGTAPIFQTRDGVGERSCRKRTPRRTAHGGRCVGCRLDQRRARRRRRPASCSPAIASQPAQRCGASRSRNASSTRMSLRARRRYRRAQRAGCAGETRAPPRVSGARRREINWRPRAPGGTEALEAA